MATRKTIRQKAEEIMAEGVDAMLASSDRIRLEIYKMTKGKRVLPSFCPTYGEIRSRFLLISDTYALDCHGRIYTYTEFRVGQRFGKPIMQGYWVQPEEIDEILFS